MENKVRVYGKAQNRTALGIINAYLVIHPQATLADLRAAFPDSLNPDSGVKANFKDMNAQSPTSANWNGYFSKEDELLHLQDGTVVAVVSMWTKPSLERLVEHAKQYGIEIASFESADKGFDLKGGFRLEYLNGFVPPVVAQSKAKSPAKWIILALIVLVILGAAAWYFMGK